MHRKGKGKGKELQVGKRTKPKGRASRMEKIDQLKRDGRLHQQRGGGDAAMTHQLILTWTSLAASWESTRAT